jgi:hypothetical protein
MDQLLDDMGPHGQSVCLAAKAQARVAFEDFRDPESDPRWIMPLAQALDILHDIAEEASRVADSAPMTASPDVSGNSPPPAPGGSQQ